MNVPIVETTAVTSAKVGVSAGLLSTAVIFTDPAYGYMALIGSLVGIASTFHTIYSDKTRSFNKLEVTAEMVKAFVLGLISMPLSFLAITQGLLDKMLNLELGEFSLSLSLVMSFGFAWYFTTIVDIIIKKRRGRSRD